MQTSWDKTFLELFERCSALYAEGNNDFLSYYSTQDLDFLASIGYKPREFFDFVEDWIDQQTPSPSSALLVAAVRRDYFMTVEKAQPAAHTLSKDTFPPAHASLEGITYLPRILAKARAKLRGQLDEDLMYSCGADRRFLRQQGNIHPADFLRWVWAIKDNDAAILPFIKSQQTSS